MARSKSNRGVDSKQAQQAISTAADAAEAVIIGVGRVAERAIVQTARAVEDVRTQIGAALARIKEPPRKAATSADGRVPKAAKAPVRRRRRRPVV